MNELLQINGMQDVTWTTGNLITLGGLVATIVAFIIKIKVDKVKHDAEIEAMKLTVKDNKESIINGKNGSKARIHEVESMIKEKEQTLHLRIDRVRDDNIKSYEKLEGKMESLEQKYETNTRQIIEAITNKK